MDTRIAAIRESLEIGLGLAHSKQAETGRSHSIIMADFKNAIAHLDALEADLQGPKPAPVDFAAVVEAGEFRASESADGEFLVWHQSDPDNAVAAVFPGEHRETLLAILSTPKHPQPSVEEIMEVVMEWLAERTSRTGVLRERLTNL